MVSTFLSHPSHPLPPPLLLPFPLLIFAFLSAVSLSEGRAVEQESDSRDSPPEAHLSERKNDNIDWNQAVIWKTAKVNKCRKLEKLQKTFQALTGLVESDER